MSTRVTFLQHSDLDVPGMLGGLSHQAGWETRVCRADRGTSMLPAAGSFDVLVVLGSGESVTTRPSRGSGPSGPWWPRRWPPGFRYLGSCFGGQLLAQVLGGRVTKEAAEPEIGWRTIESVDPERIPAGTLARMAQGRLHRHPGSESLAHRAGSSLQALVGRDPYRGPVPSRGDQGDRGPPGWMTLGDADGSDPDQAEDLLGGFDRPGSRSRTPHGRPPTTGSSTGPARPEDERTGPLTARSPKRGPLSCSDRPPRSFSISHAAPPGAERAHGCARGPRHVVCY